MSYYRRLYTTGASYFFTVTTFNRQPILCHKPIRNALRQAIKKTRLRLPFIIDAWVLMPDHLHCIWTLPSGDADFSKRWSLIKRDVSLACGQYKKEFLITESKRNRRESTIWQRRYWEHQIRDENDFNGHINYVHFNPVKHGLCETPIQWPWSTFHRYVKLGVYNKDWYGE
jgi:putative transposase